MRPLSVLVVDDQKDLADMIADVVDCEGHKVTVAHTGEDAVERAKEDIFDFVFMDMKLPGINGVEAYMQIREIQPEAQVIMMTGFSLTELIQQAMDNGVVTVLHKPFDVERVLEELQKVKKAGGIVLIADDDPDLSASLKVFLGDQGFETHIAPTGREAVERVVAGDVEVLVLDLRLPILNGLEVYLELKKLGKAVPTIIITGYSEEERTTIGALESLAITGCLFKPFDPFDLLTVIKEATATPAQPSLKTEMHDNSSDLTRGSPCS